MTLFRFSNIDSTNLYTGDCISILSKHNEGSALLLRVTGKTFAQRRENLRALAIEYSWFDCGGLSMQEQSEISGFFERMGRRYGLLTEFRENCIC